MKQMRFDTSGEGDLYVVEEADFPTTRYQGSKRQIGDWLWSRMDTTDFDSLLDAFAGTGAVSHQAKRHGRRVVFNDYLYFNHQTGVAIVENDSETLDSDDIEFLTTRHDQFDYPSFIEDEFEGLYFTDEENRWLDTVRRNIAELESEYKRALAFSTVGQAALAKRPFALFHRANLDMRTRDVERSFGNETTWNRSFDAHLQEKVAEFNDAVFSNGQDNRACRQNVLDWEEPPETDAVYIDPPYHDRESGGTDYQLYYHFLEGFIRYGEWPDLVDQSVKTKRIRREETSPWTDPDVVYDAMRTVIETFADRTIFLSYNSAGLPRPEEIRDMLAECKDKVRVDSQNHQYALATDESDELLFIAHD